MNKKTFGAFMFLILAHIICVLYLALQIEKLCGECRQAISDVALVNAAILSESKQAKNCAYSALMQIEDKEYKKSNTIGLVNKSKWNQK